ncbi:mannose/fructose/sorbose PTS transporter subunit IIB [Clostridium swellfunianum]|uniref:mannose/fructose/sorbose PTS transporter subunit IIB n=1 Tax=Clostridium swellfunianum TaxID=1367462 RepID=UPI002030A90C|nr:mannose/fructose/sorbose PTS transporter subunit IIB [Clostridium swellfunianum]MCM0647614.1 mannose/fructose/sorbose PTS transporter subunit IIB [Clostridium swellfunianum]
MKIVLARIDDRLIHGQVATVWSKETKCNRIIVCNDNAANDSLRKILLVQVAPPGIKVSVVEIEKAIRAYKNPMYENDRVLFLFTNPTDVVKMVEGGVDIKSVNIGGMSFKEGKTMLTNFISVDDEDIKMFLKLKELDVELEVRKVPADRKHNLFELIQKKNHNH